MQTRNKPQEPRALELPGGRLELYEPILAGLKREVFEETGLNVVSVEGEEGRVDTEEIDHEFVVESIKPFCVYQTIQGPVDSIGIYFICRAEGELLSDGDEARDAAWRPVADIQSLMEQDPLQFSAVDRAGLLFYLRNRFPSAK